MTEVTRWDGSISTTTRRFDAGGERNGDDGPEMWRPARSVSASVAGPSEAGESVGLCSLRRPLGSQLKASNNAVVQGVTYINRLRVAQR
jgi:hypothetical protein